MSRDLRRLVAMACLAGLTQLGCTRLTRMPTFATDGNSNSDSGGSGDSSGQSADSSGDSADSSEASGDSSGASGDSSESADSSDSGGKSESGSGDGGDLAVSATVTLAVAVVVLGVIFLVRMAGRPDVDEADFAEAERQKTLYTARRYLTDNQRQIRADIARGGGAFVDELALAHGLPPALRPRLGAALQRAHGSLDAPLAAGPPTDAATERFAVALVTAVQADPALAPHLEALEARLRAGAVSMP